MPIKRVRAPAWPEKEKAGGRISEEKCRFCELHEEPIASGPGFHALTVFYPYYPEHVMVIPRAHVQRLRNLTHLQFKGLLTAFQRVLTGAKKEQGLNLVASVNEGLVAAQTIPHLHAHLFPEELAEPARLWAPHARYQDPLSKVIVLGHLARKRVSVPHWINERGALVIHFKSFSELRKPAAFSRLQLLTRELEGSFHALCRNPDQLNMLLTAEEKPGRVEAYKRILRERTGQGFGLHWAIRLHPEGGVDFMLLPRATMISLTEPNRRIAGLELFAGTKLQRVGLPEEESSAWRSREKKFHENVKRWLKA